MYKLDSDVTEGKGEDPQVLWLGVKGPQIAVLRNPESSCSLHAEQEDHPPEKKIVLTSEYSDRVSALSPLLRGVVVQAGCLGHHAEEQSVTSYENACVGWVE